MCVPSIKKGHWPVKTLLKLIEYLLSLLKNIIPEVVEAQVTVVIGIHPKLNRLINCVNFNFVLESAVLCALSQR